MNILAKVVLPRGAGRTRTLYNLSRFITPASTPESMDANAGKAYSTGNPPKDHQRADPKIGVCFNNLFRKNNELLIDFLNDTLNEKPVISTKFEIPELPSRLNINSRKGIVDIDCELKGGKRVIVELRMNKVDSPLQAQFIVNHLFSSQQEEEEVVNFNKLKRVMLVSISEDDILPYDQFYSKYRFADEKTGKTYENFLDQVKMVFMELSKFKIEPTDIKEIKSNSELWAFFFKYAPIMSEQDWDELIAKKSVLQTAREALDLSRWDKTEQLAYTSARMKAMSDDGALAVQRKQIARNMLREDIDVATVCKLTKLYPEDLVDLGDLEELEEED